jgi:hypothetical protein
LRRRAIVALQKVAAGTDKLSPKKLMDQYICTMARFQVACSAVFKHLQQTSPGVYKLTEKTLELQAWQTKTVSALRIKKKMVPLIAPLYSFSGTDWWTVLIQSWDRLMAHENFNDMDYLI